jgi:hypothetical protein
LVTDSEITVRGIIRFKMNSDIWERQMGESIKAFKAFNEYLMMGDERSLAKVREKCGKSLRLIERWSAKWRWVERVQAFEDDQARVKVKANLKAIKEMNERQVKIALVYQSKVLEHLKKLDSMTLTPALALRMFVESVKIERTARGETEAIVEQVDDKEYCSTKKVLEDPEVAKLATQLLKRVMISESDKNNR